MRVDGLPAQALSLRLDPARVRLLSGTRTGEVIAVKVIEALSGNRVIVEARGVQIMARTTLPLTGGQTLQAQVARVDGEIVLRQVPGSGVKPSPLPVILARGETASGAGDALRMLSNNPLGKLDPANFPGLSRALSRLQQFANAGRFDAAAAADSSALAGALARLGLGRKEAKRTGRGEPRGLLAVEGLQKDLVRALRREGPALLSGRAQWSHADIESLLSGLKSIGGHLDRLAALQRAAGPGELLLEIPVGFGEETVPVSVRFSSDRDAEGKAEAEELRLDLFLDLERMGPIRVEHRYRSGKVSIRLIVEKRAIAESMRAALPELEGSLEADGLAVNAVEIVNRTTRDPVADAIARAARRSGPACSVVC